MGKHYNIEHEVLIRTEFKNIKEPEKRYMEGDEIQQKEVVNSLEFFIPIQNDYLNAGYLKASITPDMIKSLYKQITKIEENQITGKYSILPF